MDEPRSGAGNGVSFTVSITVNETGVPTSVPITNCQTGAVETGNFVPLTPVLAGEMQVSWWSGVGPVLSPPADEPDNQWHWPGMVGRATWLSGCICMQTTDGAIQGAMIYRANGRSFTDPGMGAVYGEYLATAPSNRPWLVENPCYRGVGTGLMFHAVCQSYSLGLGGRVTLHSLPESVGYYTKLGFERTGPEEEGTIPCELPPERATEWIEKEGLL